MKIPKMPILKSILDSKIFNLKIFDTLKGKILLIVFNFFSNITALMFFMLKIAYPYHRTIAALIYGISWIPLVLAIPRKRHEVKFIRRYAFEIMLVLGSLVTLWIILTVFPAKDFSMLLSDKAELSKKINQEIIFAEKYTEKLDESEKIFLKEVKGVDLANIDSEKKMAIIEAFAEYMRYYLALDKILDDNRYFYQLNYLEYKELNEKSFVLAYSSFTALYSSSLNILKNTKDIEYLEPLLNEENPILEIPKDSYLKLKTAIADPANLVQANAGYAYLLTINQPKLSTLKDYSINDYSIIFSYYGKDMEFRLDGSADYLEKNLFKTWFPIQKEVSEYMGDTKIPVKYEVLIKQEDIDKLKPFLEPGDVILERRNWYLSNAGLPGFWKHTVIYISNLSVLDDYFKDTVLDTDLTEGLPVSKYLKKNYPDLYAEFLDGKLRTIEAESEGIVSLTVDISLSADYAAVLRPMLSKEEKLKALIYVFNQYGKPYDFNFDFLTDNELVCSELYYKAYPQFNHELRSISGRLVLSSNHIAEDFATDYFVYLKENNIAINDNTNINNNGKLEFIYFLDGSIKEGKSEIGDINSFLESAGRISQEILMK
jgi:hypothetical protein